MRVVLQRVSGARVSVDDREVASIGPGFVALVGVGRGDPETHVAILAAKVAGLRVFADDEGRMDRSIVDVGGAVLVVPQFTLYANLRKGRRPSWTDAEDPAVAAGRVEAFAAALAERGVPVARGVFGAHMEVALVNDGPVTLVLDADRL
jgi:D-tyrosyl-tRNA(Tyr) deacylase